VAGWWWLMAGGWWLVAGGWLAGGWWLVAGGWWLVVGLDLVGWIGLGRWVDFGLVRCLVWCLLFVVVGVVFDWCCLCLGVALVFGAFMLPWRLPWCCLGLVMLGVALGRLALLGCLVVLLGGAAWCYLGGWGLGLRLRQGWMDDEEINEGDRWRGFEHEQEC